MSSGRLPSAAAALALALAMATPAFADPLDKISGTESWRAVVGVDVEAEWKAWYRGRVKWRRARRALRLERVRNRYLARLLARAGVFQGRRVRRIVRARLRRRSRSRRWRRRSRTQDQDEDDLLLAQERRRRRRRAWRRNRTPAPPVWTKVPVEKLDSKGQAIDTEGDKVLDRAGRKKR